MQRTALAGDAAGPAAQPIPSAADEPCEMTDAYHWLAALRLDRAAAAVADPD